MALIICPECGKEYSNKAAACPNCACPTNISVNMVEPSNRGKSQPRENANNKQATSQRKTPVKKEGNEEKKEVYKVDSSKRPEKPVFNRKFLVYLIIATLFSVLFAFDDEFGIGTTIFGILIYVLLPLGIYLSNSYLPAREKYELFLKDPKAYCRLINKEEKEAAESRAKHQSELNGELEYAKYTQEHKAPWERFYTFPCPYCGHYKVRDANWDDKKVSVAVAGPVMSSKLSKKYKCMNCRKMWN